MEWTDPQTMLLWRSNKLGRPLEVIRQQGVMTDRKTPVYRYSIIDYKKDATLMQKAKKAETNPRSEVIFRPHLGRNSLLYISRAFTRPRSRKLGMTSSLFSLICALEKKKLFIVPAEIALEKSIYEQCGFRKGYIKAGKTILYGNVLDRPNTLKPQEWAKPNAEGKNLRRFFVK